VTSEIRGRSDRIVGYVLLAAGLVVVIVPVCFAMSILFSGSSAIPEIIKAPTVSFDASKISIGGETVFFPISEADLNDVVERLFLAVNAVLFFVVAVILISAGSVVMGKGIGLISEMKLRVVKVQVSEEVGVKGAENGVSEGQN
jgi:hypothetical protein